MPPSILRRSAQVIIAMCALVAAVVGLTATNVSAHNTLISSDPADGAVLSNAPAHVTWVFDNAVPLETMTVTLIDALGARTELGGSTHGATGDTEVITPMPSLPAGPVSVRWRLVGPDGHPITGRIDFTIEGSSPSTVVSTATTAPGAVDTTLPPAMDSPSFDVVDAAYSTPSSLRWTLRYASYVAIMAVVGILLTTAYVWFGAGAHPMPRRLLHYSLLATTLLGFLQLLVIASDVSGDVPWSSLRSIDAATSTDAGMALVFRMVLAMTLWLVVFRSDIVHRDLYWTAVALPGLGLLATWAFAGHSSSMRWPAIGVVTDVAHHAAAAAWIAGLAIVGWIVIPQTAPDVLVPVVRRFSQVAAVSVGVLVATGLVQTVRLVGNPVALFDVDHGQYLAVKVLVLGAMLAIANANRRRIDKRLDDTATLSRYVGGLRRSVVTEFALGVVIVGVTAAMVVSPPASTAREPGAPQTPRTPVYYTM